MCGKACGISLNKKTPKMMTSSEYKASIKAEKTQRTFTFSGHFPITAKPSRQSRLHSRRVLCNIVVVELRGIEPLSENSLTGLSPGADDCLHSLAGA